MIVNKGSRKSQNIEDVRSGKGKTKNDLAVASVRQIFNPKLTKGLTRVSNSMANADRLANKGAGAKAMKAPGKANMFTQKFTKKGK
jgi:hypothetical protein